MELTECELPGLTLVGAHTDRECEIVACTVTGTLDMRSLSVGGRLALNGTAVRVSVGKAAIDAQSLAVDEDFWAFGLDCAGSFYLNHARVQDALVLHRARIGSLGTGALQAPELKVGGGLYLDDRFRAIGMVNLYGASIGGSVVLSHATLTGHLTGLTRVDAVWNLYGEDENGTLWAMRQDHERPREENGTMRWAPPVPIDRNIGGTSISHAPGHSTALFSYTRDGTHLRLDVQDELTGMWQEMPLRIHVPDPKAGEADERTSAPEGGGTRLHETTRHRLEAALTDAQGAPVPRYRVLVRVADGCAPCRVVCQGRTVVIGRDPSELFTDAYGRLTISLLADGIATPRLELTAQGLPGPVVLEPGRTVHEYLAGKRKTLNPSNPGGGLPEFTEDGGALKRLVPGVDPGDAGSAAKAIRKGAAIGLGETTSDAGFVFAVDHGGAAGRSDGVTFRDLRSEEELLLELDLMNGNPGVALAPGATDELAEPYMWGWAKDLWNKMKKVGGDIWQGLKRGAMVVEKAVVEGGKKLVPLAVRIGKVVIEGVKLAFHALQQVAHFITRVLKAIGAAIEKVIEWLKALFAFRDIWNTKKAFEQAMRSAGTVLRSAAGEAAQDARQWVGQEKRDLHPHIERFVRQHGSSSLAPKVPDSHSGVPGATSGHDVHRNWLMDKVQAQPLTLPSTAGSTVGDEVPDSLAAWVDKAVGSLGGAGVGYARAIGDLLKSPEASLKEFATSSEAIIDMGLDLVGALVAEVERFVANGLLAFQSMLDTELSLGPLNKLWEWLADLADHPGDKLTFGGLLALLAALPATIGYKLLYGSDNQPFPGGSLPDPAAMNGDGRNTEAYDAIKTCIMAGGLLQAMSVMTATMADVLGEETPDLLTGVSIALAVIIFGLAHAGLVWKGLKWMGLGGSIFAGTALAAVVGIGVWQFLKSEKAKAFARTAGPIILTVLVLGGLGYIIYQAIEKDLTGWALAGSLLIVITGLTACLNIPKFRDSQGWWSIPTKVAIDTIGNAVGGALAVVAADSRSAFMPGAGMATGVV
ncbi:hypothetical protein [Streptomyces griseocarneus]|uniref:hypothetical protein n=1 Tax=Streptomyces griseocarneus TaxID=51201 RepID=UPI00167F05C9|nr:hypothetical protein [Streptomyces griseocarneus]MBZ6475406.1 hypothetical protein [Streptomyces griseocarneus]GHG75107.1 hypothetical protein GCM10018779_52380 [Streptomyces griseocarneus]